MVKLIVWFLRAVEWEKQLHCVKMKRFSNKNKIMETTQTTKSYQDLQLKIKLQLARGLELKKIKIEELMAILFILGQTNTTDELEMFVEIFSDSFPILKTIHLQTHEHTKRNIEVSVKKTISKILLVDPIRATQLAKEALQKNVNWDDLVKKYPELNEN
jgi:hypothetical protein